MFSHITVPVDGSHFAESAIPYATSIARRTDGRVELVIVEEAGLPPRVIERIDRLGIEPDSPEAEQRSPAAHYIAELAAAVHRRSGVPVTAAVLAGRPVDALVEHIGRTGTSLVVMATHGRGAFSRVWLGGVADEMAHVAAAPVLLVRPRKKDEPVPEDVTLREVLVPLDGSPHGEEVLTLAAPLAAATDAHLTLLRVAEIRMLAGSPFAPNMIQFDDVGLEAERAQAEQYLDGVAARLRHRGFTVRTAVIEGIPAMDVIAYADEHDADVIAMSTHGYGGLKRLLLGSVADKVLRGTHRPVLLYRPVGTG